MNNKKISFNVAHRALEVKIELERNTLNLSDEKLVEISKNNITRLKACDLYCKSSVDTLEYIVLNSSVSIDELMNFSNVKSSKRVLSLSNMMLDKKQDNAQLRVVSALNSALKSYDAIPFGVVHRHFGGAEMMLKSLLRVRMILGLLVRADNQDYSATINNDTLFTVTNK